MRQFLTRYSLLLFLTFFVSAIFSCQEVIDLDIPRGEEQLVVEGWITDQPGPYTVSLSTTIAYNGGEEGQGVTGARVKIFNDLGSEYILQETDPGIYQSQDLQGTVGVSYWLNIQSPQGEEYQSKPEKLQAVTPIEEIYTQLKPENGEHHLLIGFQDPPGGLNYYRWKVYKNEELMDAPNEMYVSDNQLFSGQMVEGLNFSKRTFFLGTTVRVEQMSISGGAFRFFSQTILQWSTGSPLDTPPAPIIGNIYKVNNPNEYALGYFGASSVTEAEILVEE